ncbi:hypothetical protein C8R43DRAFT_359147 [Mycena crocata]|nr:hypothetical protein C8R43DRAFT_359147 [Mycena crocata]
MTETVGDPLSFVVVGASVAGLASAVALKKSGHNVLVLEKDTVLGGTGPIPGGQCARVPPNGGKILTDWGLDAEIKAHAAVSEGFGLYKYNGGKATGRDFLGINRWDPELLTEARGEFVQFRHRDLVRILYDATVGSPQSNGSNHRPHDIKMKGTEDYSPRVTVVFGAEVARIDCHSCSVTLLSGDVHTADAIIGADGLHGVVRQALMEEEDASAADDVFTGLAMYGAMIPKALAVNDPDLAMFYEWPKGTVSMGSNRGSITIPTGKENDIALWLYTPDSTQNGTWKDEAERKLSDVLGPSDVHFQKLAALAGPTTCLQVQDHYELESWVSSSGRVMVLGEAAHPFPPASLHCYSAALEDGAFIGKIFSHTRDRNRIPEFLYAFQEHREARCLRIRDIEKGYIAGFITLPDGEMQVERDAAMRANHAAGRNVIDSPESELQQMLDDTRMIFGYDPSDDADEWWMTWGRYRSGSGTEAAEPNHRVSWTTFSSFTEDNQVNLY